MECFYTAGEVSAMRKMVAVLVMLVASVAAYGQTGNLEKLGPEQLEIVKVLVAQEKAWNRGDLDGFAVGYKDSPDTLFVGRQISRGYAQMLTDYKHNYPNRGAMGVLAFTDLEVHMLDEKYAVVLGKYELERAKKDGGAAGGVFSLVFEKGDKGWKIIVDHTT